jgi:hypothetical protein
MPQTNTGLWNWLGCSTLLAVSGCAHTNQPAMTYAPPPGATVVPAGAAIVPAPGCGSCGPSTNPALTAPRYGPPVAAPPPIASLPVGGIMLGVPVHARTPQPMVTQATFQPPPLEAHLGAPIFEEGPGIPLPPTEEAQLPLITKK